VKKSASQESVEEVLKPSKAGPGKMTKSALLNLNPSKHKILDKIARDLCKRKAVKSDNAAIPEYLWEDHLSDDNMPIWTLCDWVGLPGAMDLLRERTWMKEEHPLLCKKKETRVTKGEVGLQRDAQGRAQSWWQWRARRKTRLQELVARLS
jgi:hypothetical protein